jgi:hypothetical protein
MNATTCEICGKPAAIHVADVVDGVMHAHHYCLSHAAAHVFGDDRVMRSIWDLMQRDIDSPDSTGMSRSEQEEMRAKRDDAARRRRADTTRPSRAAILRKIEELIERRLQLLERTKERGELNEPPDSNAQEKSDST